MVICCKGLSKQPCSGCSKLICPTGGHNEGTSKIGGWHCWDCYNRIAPRIEMDNFVSGLLKKFEDNEEVKAIIKQYFDNKHLWQLKW